MPVIYYKKGDFDAKDVKVAKLPGKGSKWGIWSKNKKNPNVKVLVAEDFESEADAVKWLNSN